MPLVTKLKKEERLRLFVEGMTEPIELKLIDSGADWGRVLTTAPPNVQILREGQTRRPDSAPGVIPMVNPRGTPAPDHRKSKRA